MKIPRIKSEYRVLFKPEINGNYVNDHCIVSGPDGKEHLFGITSHNGHSYDEKYFVHASGESLEGKFTELGRAIDRGTLAWAPCVTERDGVYYMIYGPSPTSLAVSNDMLEWFGYKINIENEPLMAVHRDHFVLKTDGGYIMYASGVKDKRGCISVMRSDDLISWSFCGYALESGENAELNDCAWGAFESPFVVEKDGLFYLFTTYTNCSKENYNDTLVFVSDNPLRFGVYKGNRDNTKPITKLSAHAPEILLRNGKYYITSCGWIDAPTPHKGCVSVAELEFTEKD